MISKWTTGCPMLERPFPRHWFDAADRAPSVRTGAGCRTHRWPSGVWRSGEVGSRPPQRGAVEGDVDLLVVEGDQPGDRQQLPGGEVVGPRQVAVEGVPGPH